MTGGGVKQRVQTSEMKFLRRSSGLSDQERNGNIRAELDPTRPSETTNQWAQDGKDDCSQKTQRHEETKTRIYSQFLIPVGELWTTRVALFIV